ncbi:unnamed protein product, partial [Sphacelaria rigidula]
TAVADGGAGAPVKSPISVSGGGERTDSGPRARSNGSKNYIDLLVRASVMSDSLSMSDSSLSAAYARRNSAAGSAAFVTAAPTASNFGTMTATTAGARARVIPNGATTLSANSHNHNDSHINNHTNHKDSRINNRSDNRSDNNHSDIDSSD